MINHGAAAQLVEQGPGLLQLYWRGFKSQVRHKVNVKSYPGNLTKYTEFIARIGKM